ncbi:MAG: DUF4396 domain-containing protein, partial [Nocardioides sp.]|nr:DUF4396 domain-containing protein [Nocardioides sp.]
VPDWLTPIAWVFIGLALATAVVIAVDIYVRRHRHTTVAAELVWITSALYLGPFALAAYARWGRADVATGQQPTVVAGLPGGGASAVAHLIGVPLVIASGLTIAGINLWVMILVIGVLAMVMLFAYERTAHRRGGGLSAGTALMAAVVTVLAFDIGMGGWMLLLHFNEYMPPATEASFWFLMQVGIVLGLATGYPAVQWLLRRRQTALPA